MLVRFVMGAMKSGEDRKSPFYREGILTLDHQSNFRFGDFYKRRDAILYPLFHTINTHESSGTKIVVLINGHKNVSNRTGTGIAFRAYLTSPQAIDIL
jgi:hypothetical protein